MRLALPVDSRASWSMMAWIRWRTGVLASTSFIDASAPRPLTSRQAGAGKISAPTSFMFRPVSTTSCT